MTNLICRKNYAGRLPFHMTFNYISDPQTICQLIELEQMRERVFRFVMMTTLRQYIMHVKKTDSIKDKKATIEAFNFLYNANEEYIAQTIKQTDNERKDTQKIKRVKISWDHNNYIGTISKNIAKSSGLYILHDFEKQFNWKYSFPSGNADGFE